MIVIRYILAAVIGYLLGSISTGIIVARKTGGPDLHTVGSKSTGATNALRVMGVKRGLIVFWGDAIKALVACAIGYLLVDRGAAEGTMHYGMMLAGVTVILGHNWPCFFGFKGGKGVACSCGVMLINFPVPAIICFVITLTLIAITRYVSLGSMTMVTLFALLGITWFAHGDLITILWTLVLAGICIWRHHANIGRLLHGKENKLGAKAK